MIEFDYFADVDKSDLMQVKTKWKQLAKEYHPDITDHSPETFQIINNQYEKIINGMEGDVDDSVDLELNTFDDIWKYYYNSSGQPTKKEELELIADKVIKQCIIDEIVLSEKDYKLIITKTKLKAKEVLAMFVKNKII